MLSKFVWADLVIGLVMGFILGIILTLTLVANVAPPPAHGSALSDAANAMSPGTWVQLSSATGLSAFATDNSTILEYANRGTWDAVGKRMYFCGVSHTASLFYNKCVTYDEATNAFSNFSLPTGITYGPHNPSTMG